MPFGQRPRHAGRGTFLPRFLSYNVRRCLGMDGMLSPARIAAVIAEYRPDIVALQELDVRRIRSDSIDQAHEIARELDMRHVYFNAALRVMEEEYGDAVLTMLPSRLVKAGPLPGLSHRPALEPRGALWAAVEVDGVELQVINTHLGLGRAERLAQAEALLGEEWLGHPHCRNPAILLGDFNSLPSGRDYKRRASRLRDAQVIAPAKGRAQATFPSLLPMLRIDHVFVSRGIKVLDARRIGSPLARVASDHLPLLVDFELTAE